MDRSEMRRRMSAVLHADPPLGVHGWLLAAALIAVLVISRRPDAVTYAQFWAEDGPVWFQQLYDRGFWEALVQSNGGYLNVYPRLAAASAQLLPLRWMPLAFNLSALAVHAACALFLISRRWSPVIPSLAFRAGLALIVIGLPIADEVHANLTNVHAHLAALAVAVVLAPSTATLAGLALDMAVLLIASLSAPEALLLLPTAALMLWRERTPRRALVTGALLAGCLLQAAVISVSSPLTNRTGALGASGSRLVHDLGAGVFLNGLLGPDLGWALWHLGTEETDVAAAPLIFIIAATLAAALGFSVTAFALMRGPLALRGLVVFGALTSALALTCPLRGESRDLWAVLGGPGGFGRYGFLPTLVFLVTLTWGAVAGPLRPLWRGLLALALIGMAANWRLPLLPRMDWEEACKRFESAAPGERVYIAINPRPFYILVVKR